MHPEPTPLATLLPALRRIVKPLAMGGFRDGQAEVGYYLCDIGFEPLCLVDEPA
jgi:hypothetical protein